MLIKNTDDKERVYRDIINMGLKNPRIYCNNCDETFIDFKRPPCCDDPQLGTNYSFTKAIVKQNRDIRATRLKVTAATKNNSLRWGVSMPKWMYELLDRYERMQGEGRKLFKDKNDVAWFAKRFKAFAIPERY